MSDDPKNALTGMEAYTAALHAANLHESLIRLDAVARWAGVGNRDGEYHLKQVSLAFEKLAIDMAILNEWKWDLPLEDKMDIADGSLK